MITITDTYLQQIGDLIIIQDTRNDYGYGIIPLANWGFNNNQDTRNDYGYGYTPLATCGFNYYSGYEE